MVRAVETVYAVEEALRIIDAYERPARPFVDVPARPGVGHGVSEAPRGLLYHRYEIDDDGLISRRVIVPPTSQNQAAIEDDLARVVVAGADLDDAALTSMCERAIRNYDPCISCATHFLTLTVQAALMRRNGVVVIGVGNTYRRDDGVGPGRGRRGGRGTARGSGGARAPSSRPRSSTPGTGPTSRWSIDAAGRRRRRAGPGAPVRARAIWPTRAPVTSHDLSLAQTYELARVLDRAPAAGRRGHRRGRRPGHGVGLSPAVAAGYPAGGGGRARRC